MMRAKNVVAVAVAGAAVLGLPLATATAAFAAPMQQATADLNGDGTPDHVVLSAIGDGSTDRLSFTVDGRTSSVTLPGDPEQGPQPIRVTDMNGDGSREVAINQSVGANTDHFTVWDFDGAGPRELHLAGGGALELPEGGGIAGRFGYECAGNAAGGRDLITLGATAEDPGAQQLAYDGIRVRYSVQNGVATQVNDYRISHAGQQDPVLSVNPHSCA